ncbi:MAG TPA: hypothetical protein VN843_32045 [Anaerolineales bacterium]|jgi:hypothetical protein|nr:hypothetical protein [Anaerolineales bacterium]
MSTSRLVKGLLLHEEENKFNPARDAQLVINPEKIVAHRVLSAMHKTEVDGYRTRR